MKKLLLATTILATALTSALADVKECYSSGYWHNYWGRDEKGTVVCGMDVVGKDAKGVLLATTAIVAALAQPAMAQMYIGVPADTFVAPKWRDVPNLPSASRSSEYVTNRGFASRTFKGRRDFSRYINQGSTRNPKLTIE